ncbi:Uncharacterised protein [Mycobacteroides abscessus subsp. abscessus]|nr:Uncharacterised protein [Mycobacteroides abscessus subsp. abscessus]
MCVQSIKVGAAAPTSFDSTHIQALSAAVLADRPEKPQDKYRGPATESGCGAAVLVCDACRSADQKAASSSSITSLSMFSTTPRTEVSSGSMFLAKKLATATLPS